MHGRPRKTPSPEDASAAAAKAIKLRDLQTKILHNHHNRIYTQEALAVSLKLLEINPEVLYGWNYRKLAFDHNLGQATDPDAVQALVDEELRVVEIALRKNPKSYGAWHHRKWVLGRRLLPLNSEREFRLIEQLLAADPRNFHGWNYRRFVAALKGASDKEELGFTKKMIDNNFSNYSAWHNRSVLLSRLLKEKAEGFESEKDTLTEEFYLVHQALFTDAEDQSGWFYHLWLLDRTVNPNPLLISSWPVHGFDYVLFTNENTSYYKLFPLPNSSLYYSLPKGTFPITLYFNEAVKGVSSSTITVKSSLAENEVFIWRPMSTTTTGHARCWVTYLSILDFKSCTLEAYSVEISLGRSQGITTSSGSCYNHPFQLKFTIKLSSVEPEQSEHVCDPELFSWDDDNMYVPEASPDSISFHQVRITDDDVVDEWRKEILSLEICQFKDLFEADLLAEENSKFLMLTLAQLYKAYDAMLSNYTLMQKRIPPGDVLRLLEDLIKLDPSHTGYYEDERSLVLIDRVTSDKESLMRHCWNFDKSTSSIFQHHACLRLNKLSLTRIGFVERLLWVQTLDLSYNKLRSIEGLEALQLLTCLNLSNNHISSFTTLEPLKLLISLRVLNISFNDIGSHPVNTTKYLCSSPFSHTKDIDWNSGDNQKKNIKIADHWEAILLFKDLHLMQLDVKGNAVAGKNLEVVLTTLLPSLHWLDGECVQR